MNRTFPTGRLLWALFSGVAIIGCGPKVLPPSGPHPVLSTEQVKIFQKPPAKYETLGIMKVPVTPEMKWDERGDSTAGFEALKSKAGSMGANGVLLTIHQNLFDTQVGVGYKGKYYLVPLVKSPRTAVAEAVFVVEE